MIQVQNNSLGFLKLQMTFSELNPGKFRVESDDRLRQTFLKQKVSWEEANLPLMETVA
jgi:hypothetical protein